MDVPKDVGPTLGYPVEVKLDMHMSSAHPTPMCRLRWRFCRPRQRGWVPPPVPDIPGHSFQWAVLCNAKQLERAVKRLGLMKLCTDLPPLLHSLMEPNLAPAAARLLTSATSHSLGSIRNSLTCLWHVRTFCQAINDVLGASRAKGGTETHQATPGTTVVPGVTQLPDTSEQPLDLAGVTVAATGDPPACAALPGTHTAHVSKPTQQHAAQPSTRQEHQTAKPGTKRKRQQLADDGDVQTLAPDTTLQRHTRRAVLLGATSRAGTGSPAQHPPAFNPAPQGLVSVPVCCGGSLHATPPPGSPTVFIVTRHPPPPIPTSSRLTDTENDDVLIEIQPGQAQPEAVLLNDLPRIESPRMSPGPGAAPHTAPAPTGHPVAAGPAHSGAMPGSLRLSPSKNAAPMNVVKITSRPGVAAAQPVPPPARRTHLSEPQPSPQPSPGPAYTSGGGSRVVLQSKVPAAPATKLAAHQSRQPDRRPPAAAPPVPKPSPAQPTPPPRAPTQSMGCGPSLRAGQLGGTGLADKPMAPEDWLQLYREKRRSSRAALAPVRDHNPNVPMLAAAASSSQACSTASNKAGCSSQRSMSEGTVGGGTSDVMGTRGGGGQAGTGRDAPVLDTDLLMLDMAPDLQGLSNQAAVDQWRQVSAARHAAHDLVQGLHDGPKGDLLRAMVNMISNEGVDAFNSFHKSCTVVKKSMGGQAVLALCCSKFKLTAGRPAGLML